MIELKAGVYQEKSPKGKGCWVARWKDQERVFYDGSYGTTLAAKNAAEKWYNEQVTGGEQEQVYEKRVKELMAWLEGVKEEKVSVEEVGDAIMRIMMPHMKPEAKPVATFTKEEVESILGRKL